MHKHKSILKIIILTLTLLSLFGCNNSNKPTPDKDKIQIITTLFPQYDFTKEIVGDKGEVSLLLPPGVEAHSYEPTPRDIVSIRNADVFIYTSKAMEPWAIKMVSEISSEDLKVIDLSEGIQLIDIDGLHDHGDEDHDHEDDFDGKDPHIWLDPVYAQTMVENITKGLIEVDKNNETFYTNNSEAYIEKLKALDASFTETFSKTKSDTILYGGHFAFGYFTERYGLKHISPYIGFSPNAEPTPNRIVELIKTLETAEFKVIYYEELVDPKVAKTISDQTGAKMLMLHGAHNISKEEIEAGVSYLEIMYENQEKLKEGLGYGK
ncbi:MAG: zinc ABC transporter solute-binding protein [Erysipelothrix sp.]|nr:zinc ABC transporter solute-binding protein [Erysipelothrix sp.]